MYCSQKLGEDFATFCGLLRIYELLKNFFLGRCGQPEEVAKAIAFLASLDASFICGQTLAVDGGRSITCPS